MKIKTLVVDNNPVLLKAVSSILEQEGCDVQTAETGLSALEILDSYSPDIVFTDLIMPLVSGEKLCKIIRNTTKHADIFVVVLSAIVLEDRERILNEVECDLCIAKGSLKELRQHLREALQIYEKRKQENVDKSSKATRIPTGLKPSAMASELLSEKRHLSMILGNLAEGILELSDQGKIVTANRAALKILRCDEEELIGVLLPDVIDWGPLLESVTDWTREQLVAGGMQVMEILENSPLSLESRIITGSLLPVADSEKVFGLCILRDISRQFQAEKHNKEVDEAIKLVKKMDAMSCMAGGVAHDFNNLLTVICGNLDIVALHGHNQTNKERTNLIEQARKAALGAVDLTRQISCFSNFGIIQRETVSVNKIVQNSAQTYFKDEITEHQLKYLEEDVLIYVDPEEISLAIHNVLQNAKETLPEGKIEIAVTKNDFSAPKLLAGQYVPAGSYARIDISDFGKGIEPEQLFRVFDPYYSTKERGHLKGMGLGLTIVYATLRNHGGYVVVSSTPKKKTTVSLFIPVKPKEILQEKPDDKKSGKEQPVILVEPYKQMSDIGKIMLSHLGFSVTAVGNSKKAIKQLKEFVGDPKTKRPLVILDLSEKGGQSAVETCKMLHQIDSKVKVIAMSGTLMNPVMENCMQYGFANILPKPYTIDSLKHITNTVLYN